MSSLRYLVPYLVFAFFLIRSRRSPIYLISLPLVLLFGAALYLDFYLVRVAVAGVQFGLQDILLVLQLLGWGYIVLKRPSGQQITRNFGYRVALIALAYYFVIMVLSLPSLERVFSNAILTFPRFFYLPLGFLIMLDTYRRFTRREVMMLLRDLSAVTVFLSFLYILNALLPGSVYELTGSDYIAELDIVRLYSAFPYWSRLAILYLAVSSTSKLIAWGGLGILVFSAVFYYSRSFLLIALLSILCGQLVVWAKKRRMQLIIRQMVTIGLLLVVLLAAITVARPQVDFLARRFEGILNFGISADVNLQERMEYYRVAWLAIEHTDAWMGLGAFSSGSDNVWITGSWDSDYFPVIVCTGLIGVAVYLIPQLMALVASFFLLAKRSGEGFTLSLIAGLYVLGNLIWSLFSINYTLYPTLSTFALVLVAIESDSLWMQPERV